MSTSSTAALSPVLAGITLQLAPGERVAIVGPSGSGKSTLAMLIPRFYDPTAGRVSIDGIDVRRVRLHSLRKQIGVVFEESFLFSDSVRANIAYGRPDATDAQIEAAARAAQAHAFIEDLPRGYDTTVGERGLSLSGGQRQRIALARAILYDPRVLILDDATSAIDARIEAAVHDALRGVLAGRTTLLIAHRRSTLHLADRIVVLDDGGIVEQGTHDELVARSVLYRTLLSGLDEEEAEHAGDSIEALARMTTSTGADGTTASAWGGASPARRRARGPGAALERQASVPVSAAVAAGGGSTSRRHPNCSRVSRVCVRFATSQTWTWNASHGATGTSA